MTKKTRFVSSFPPSLQPPTSLAGANKRGDGTSQQTFQTFQYPTTLTTKRQAPPPLLPLSHTTQPITVAAPPPQDSSSFHALTSSSSSYPFIGVIVFGQTGDNGGVGVRGGGAILALYTFTTRGASSQRCTHSSRCQCYLTTVFCRGE